MKKNHYYSSKKEQPKKVKFLDRARSKRDFRLDKQYYCR